MIIVIIIQALFFHGGIQLASKSSFSILHIQPTSNLLWIIHQLVSLYLILGRGWLGGTFCWGSTQSQFYERWLPLDELHLLKVLPDAVVIIIRTIAFILIIIMSSKRGSDRSGDCIHSTQPCLSLPIASLWRCDALKCLAGKYQSAFQIV